MGTKTMSRRIPSEPVAVAVAALVMLIWSSSFVLVKIALPTIGPLTIAAFRYFGAFLLMLPVMRLRGVSLRGFRRQTWLRFFGIGLSSFTVGNACIFFALQYLPATTISFLGNMIPVLVLAGGVVWLHEMPTRMQVGGVVLGVLGGVIFFIPGWQPIGPIGIVIYGIGMVAFAASTVLGREVARQRRVDTMALAALPMGLGGGLLLPFALALEGLPHPSTQALMIVVFLAVVNTTGGYLLYYHALQTLTALEMNMILNLTPFATALVAFLLLDERLKPVQFGAMVVGVIGVALVQWGRRPAETAIEPSERPPVPTAGSPDR